MIDKKGNLFGKINLFDFTVIVLIIVLLFGVAYKFFWLNPNEINEQVQETPVEVTFDLHIKSVRDITVNTFHLNDTLFYYDSEEDLGSVVSIVPNQAMDIMETLDGTIVNAPIQDRYDLVLTVKGEASQFEDGTLMMAKARIAEGMDIRVATQMANCVGTIRNLQWN